MFRTFRSGIFPDHSSCFGYEASSLDQHFTPDISGELGLSARIFGGAVWGSWDDDIIHLTEPTRLVALRRGDDMLTRIIHDGRMI